MSQLRLLSALLCVLLPAVAAAEETRLLRRPTVSRDLVVFAYASDLWAVGRTGGQARRLTATPFVETDPRLSPDGSLIAFTATVGGNTDVYVMPAAGGDPVRLTYHPGIDAARGWSPDGRRVVIASTRTAVPTTQRQPIFPVVDDSARHHANRARSPEPDCRSCCRCLGRSPARTRPMAGAWPTKTSRSRWPPSGRRSRAASGGTTAAGARIRFA